MPIATSVADNKLHLLIADDDHHDIEFFKEALIEISKDIKLSVANGCAELMEFIQAETPDFIFLDLNMPSRNGIECLADIRAVKKFNRIPIIIYSVSANPTYVYTTYKLGASMYFEKPPTLSLLKYCLSQILTSSPIDLLPQMPIDKYLVTAQDGC